MVVDDVAVRRRRATMGGGRGRGPRRRRGRHGGDDDTDDGGDDDGEVDDDDDDDETPRDDVRRFARARGRNGLNLAFVATCATYVTWVLMGTVAWVSHLGERAPWLEWALPARGWPSNAACDGVGMFLARNAPLSLIFVLPHSLALPSRLYGVVGAYGRLAYNVISAGMLHVFLWAFTPLKTPVVRDGARDGPTTFRARYTARLLTLFEMCSNAPRTDVYVCLRCFT